MHAEIRPNYDTNRKKLAEIIPLPAPFTVYIEQTRVCNLKCFYCIHSTRDDNNSEFKKLGYDIKHMDFNMYLKVIDQLLEFPADSIKRVVFSGLGEPLCNPQLPQMIKLLSDKKIANRIEIITNGLLLTPDMSDNLIKAGITNINISVQGINSEQYENTCGKKIDFKNFLDHLKYLYEHKQNVQIFIKAIDSTLKSEEEVKIFYEVFSPIADRIYIEHLVQMQQQMTQLKTQVDNTKNLHGEKFASERKVCSPAFYFLQIGCDLDIFPCPVPGLTRGLSFGNIKDTSLFEIWNGSKRNNFLKTMLKLKKDCIPECMKCNKYHCINDPLENLDEDALNLLALFE